MIRWFRYALLQFELRIAAKFLSGAIGRLIVEASDQEDYAFATRAFSVETALEDLTDELSNWQSPPT